MVSAAGYTPFFFQGKLFILYQPEGDNNGDWDNSYGTVILRCLRGSAKPFQALFKAVRKREQADSSQVEITYVLAKIKNQSYSHRKRPLHTVDIDPKAKEELIADLQDFLDEETEDFYHRNGIPYRMGYMFCGPPRIGKTSLCKAIASEWNLPFLQFNLADMTDDELKEKY